MDSAVKPGDLIRAVAQKLTDEYGQPGLRTLPENLLLEMHPSVRRALYQDPDLWYPFGEGDPDTKFEVPVHVTTDLPPGTWRLVIITADVLTGGTCVDQLP